MAKNSLSLSPLYPRSSLRFLFKHHAFVASLVVLAYLIFAIYSLNHILTQPIDEAYRSQQLSGGTNYSFNEDTIKELERLSKRQNDSVTLPPGRTNPFSE